MTTTADIAPARFPPGPPPRRGIVEHARYYLGFQRDPLGFVAGRFEKYGDIYYAPNASGGLYVLKHPDHLREVLITRAASFHKQHSAFKDLSRFLGDGLLTTDGDVWKRQRRMVNPAFAHAKLVEYADVMACEATRAVQSWRDGEVYDVGREMMQLTLRVVSTTLFGHDVTAHIDDVGRSMTTFQNTILGIDRIVPPWMPTLQRRAFRRALASLDAMTYGLIEARRKAPTTSDRSDLLDMLVRARDVEGDGGNLSDREIRDQLVTLFLAGHETTSQALTWTLYLLAQHPRVEAALLDELRSVLGDRTASYDDLEKLPYTEQVVHEAMRLFPPVYSIARSAHEDTEVGGYPVKAGSELMLWLYMTHHDARWFPEPEAFRPERFAPAEEASRPKFSYLPFGAGPRACIGKVFATIEARIVLATLVQRFRFELVDGHRVEPHPRITLVPRHGMPMRLRARPRVS